MRVVFPQAKELKNIISATVAFIPAATFVANSEGLRLSALDPAKVALVMLDIYPSAFLDFEVSEEEEKFTINLEDLKQILSKAKARDQVVWELDNDKNRFILSIIGKTTKKFYLPLIEAEETSAPTPELDLPIKVELDVKAFHEIIDSAKTISDEIKLVADPDEPKLLLIAEGELKEMEVVLTPTDEYVLDMEIPEKAEARYPIDYIHKLTKVANVSDTVTLRFADNNPIWFDYKLLDKFKYSFILAPRG